MLEVCCGETARAILRPSSMQAWGKILLRNCEKMGCGPADADFVVDEIFGCDRSDG